VAGRRYAWAVTAGELKQRALLERARLEHASRAWADARAAFAEADQLAELACEDLERWGWCAGLAGCDEEMFAVNERLFRLYEERADRSLGAQCAFWTGFRLIARGEPARGNGWLARAQRMADGPGEELAVHGWLQVPKIRRHMMAKDLEAAHADVLLASAVGERCGDLDLITFARYLQAQIKLRGGQIEDGLALLDEAMLRVTSEDLHPVVTGVVYCGAIAGCHRVYALARAREWTRALSAWCATQPQLVPFIGACLAYRVELLQLAGEWPQAIEEATRARRVASPLERAAAADALYQQAEIHRLRGELALAEQHYREASEGGRDPQPGLALLRVSQGRAALGASALRRLAAALQEPLERARLLPALLEIELALGNLEAARAAQQELSKLASEHQLEVLKAMAAHATGLISLAEGNPAAALSPLRQAFSIWQRIDAPHVQARIRVLLARACSMLGDQEGAELELLAARSTFERLGAAPDLAALTELSHAKALDMRGLSARELQILRLVAAGKTNKTIARECFLSVKTVDRHLSNIFLKLNVASRAAATAYAYEWGLV
jgi:DNA-binding CsgD family transcriptional regulator